MTLPLKFWQAHRYWLAPGAFMAAVVAVFWLALLAFAGCDTELDAVNFEK